MKIKGSLRQIASREKVGKFYRTEKYISNFISKKVWAIASSVGWYLINSNPLQAQITSDGTVGTEINTTDNVTEIVGGEARGGNLFHSFRDFSVETGNTAFFNNAADINNILSRVTGGSISEIDGLIRANGSANLILINPRGINFGVNARLDIGGSFLGSTADSVLFDDGNIFSTKDVVGEPILTIATPVGLQLGQSPAAINVTGQGHDLSVSDPLFSPVIRGENRGLSVRSGKTLALVGGSLVFSGGTVSAPGGRIELGSVEAGEVRLNSVEQGWDLSYEDIRNFQNIQLRSLSLADASGTPFIPGGSVRVQGKQLSLDGGSLLLVQNLAEQSAGAIDVNTSESVNVSGTDPSGIIRSRITNETLGIGRGGDVNVKTNRVIVEGGAAISTQTYSQNAIGTGRGGDLKIEAAESIIVEGSDAFIPSVTSSIAAASFGTGDSGNNTISTKGLETLAGGTVLSTTLGAGNGGEVNIIAEDIIAVGLQPDIFAPSGLSATTLNAGNAGSLTINTSTLTVLDGARIDSSAGATGDAGSVIINASESVKIAGGVAGSVNPSIVTSSANILDPTLQALLRLPATPSGDSGDLTINTPQLQVTEGAQATVRNDGTGNGGTLIVNANSIELNSQGTISADTQSGERGNITVDADNFILQGQSATTATAAGNGNGGNLTINTDNIVALEASQLTANADLGTGGNIDINTQGLFICQECRITASSRLGVDGVVDVDTIEPNTPLETIDVPQQLTQANTAVAVGCPAQKQLNTLSISGRGGLPPRPQERLNSESIIVAAASQAKLSSNSQAKKHSVLPLPAQGWYENTQGTVVLTAKAAKTTPNNVTFNISNCHVP